jgi:hypothetical protein
MAVLDARGETASIAVGKKFMANTVSGCFARSLRGAFISHKAFS